jgi:hypothetical protein
MQAGQLITSVEAAEIIVSESRGGNASRGEKNQSERGEELGHFGVPFV